MKEEITIETIDKALQMILPLNKRMNLMEKMAQIEAQPKTSIAFSETYKLLNNQLAVICSLIDYPTIQQEWRQSKPLELMAKLFPFLNSTDYYQKHLMEQIMPQRSKLMQIPTLEKQEILDLLSAKEKKSTNE